MQKSLAKTIEIFLPDGDPKGIKVASITSRTAEVTYIPRPKLEEAKKRPNLSNVGVYILVGSDEHTKPEVYIGEAENCIVRLSQHNAQKDFWQYALVITSKINQFTKAHGKYLEWLCYDTAKNAGRYAVNNGSTPTKSYVSEPMEADLHDSFETIAILIATLGLPLFSPARGQTTNSSEPADLVFHAKGRGGEAKGIYTEEGFVVLAGSRFAKSLSPTMEEKQHLKIRDRLIADRLLIDQGDYFELTEDAVFSTPSNAAASVVGHASNGWTAWKLPDGRTLSDIYRS